MLNICSDTTRVPNSEFLARMSILRRNYVDREHWMDLLEQDKAVLSATERLMLEYMNFHSDNRYEKINKNILRDYLVKVEEIPLECVQKFDRKKGAYVFSMDASIMERLIKNNISPYLMELYEHYQSLESKYNFARSQLNSLIETNITDRNGKKLHAMPFYYTVKSTGRIYTKSVSIQSFSHRYNSIHVAPKDYFLLWGDFSQIDLRVALELCLTGEGSLKKNLIEYEDKYEAFSRSMHFDKGHEFDLEKFTEDRDKYKAGILAPIYGMSERAVQHKVGDVEVGSGIYNYINNNKKYQDYSNNVDININTNLDFYCETYFGTRMPVSRGTGNKKTASLNKPIQGTSSDIMSIVTVEMYNRIISKVKDKSLFIPLVNVHDETRFLVHKSIIPYMNEFIDCTRIQVDDWATLEIEWGAGYAYGEEDENLMKQLKQTLKANPLTPRKISKRTKRYNATPVVRSFNWSVLEYGNLKFSLIQSFYNNVAIFTVHKNTINIDSIFNLLKEKWTKEVREADRIIMYCTKEDYKVIDGKELISCMPRGTNNYLTDKLNKGLASRYLRNVIKREPPEEWVQTGDIELRRRLDLECRTEIL